VGPIIGLIILITLVILVLAVIPGLMPSHGDIVPKSYKSLGHAGSESIND